MGNRTEKIWRCLRKVCVPLVTTYSKKNRRKYSSLAYLFITETSVILCRVHFKKQGTYIHTYVQGVCIRVCMYVCMYSWSELRFWADFVVWYWGSVAVVEGKSSKLEWIWLVYNVCQLKIFIMKMYSQVCTIKGN